MKSFVFRIINSFFVIFYTAYLTKGSTLKDLFFLLAPILVTKQINNIATSVVAPWFWYKFKQNRYFKRLKKRAEEQQETSKKPSKYYQDYDYTSESNQGQDHLMNIIKSKKKDFNMFYRRHLTTLNDKKEKEKEKENEKESGKPQKPVQNDCDMDGIELNSMRNNFLDTVNFFEEGMIEFGYLTWFAAAFPLGPLMALILDTLEVR